MPYVDFQSFFNVLTHISPLVETFGWNILVASQPIMKTREFKAEKQSFQVVRAYILEEQQGTRQ